MYIQLGNTKINKQNVTYSNFIIIAEVINSNMSFEKPVLVHTIDELNIWFGKDYEDYNYLASLIKGNVTLYLTGPISTNPFNGSSDYIDYSGWSINTDFHTLDTIVSPESNIIYKVDDGTEYIYLNSELIDINLLPQNVYDFQSGSLYNRDTLKIYPSKSIASSSGLYVKDTSGTVYARETSTIESYRLYKTGDTGQRYNIESDYTTPQYQIEQEGKSISLTGIDLDKIKESEQAYVYELHTPIALEKIGGNYVLSDDGDVSAYLDTELKKFKVSNNSEDRGFTILNYSSKDTVNIQLPNSETTTITDKSTVSLLLSSVDSINGYSVSANKITSDFPVNSNHDYYGPAINNNGEIINVVLDSDGNITNTDFKEYSEAGFYIEPLYQETHNLLEQSKNEDPVVFFWSKTIGLGDDINIIISDDYVELTRGTYTETIEYQEQDAFDTIIDNTSKLVHCESFNNEFKYWPKGTYTMHGSWKQKDMSFIKGLDLLLNETDICPDFTLIPDISVYQDDFGVDFVDYSNSCGTQFLINNTISDYKNNYIDDKDNRLIYFYGNVIFNNGISLPSYTVFLNGILNNTYSILTSEVFYDTTNLPSDLEEYKSNYLTDTGQSYYWYTYFDGSSYTSTGLMRFVISKVTRELIKNKWSILSQRTNSNIRGSVDSILNNITNSFTIIRQISITSFSISGQKLTLEIYTELSDLLKTNITIDITINYGNKNNGI